MEQVEFVGTRRSQMAMVRYALWGSVGLGLLMSVLRSGFTVGTLFVGGVTAATIGLIDWGFLRRAGAGRRIALVDAQGIQSPLFSTSRKEFAWSEVAGAREVNGMLQLELVPRPGLRDRRSFWNGVNPARPQVPLAGLVTAEQERLLQLVLERAGGEEGAVEAVNVLRERRLFNEQLRALAPRPWLTFALVGLNVAMWLLVASRTGDPLQAGAPVLLAWGGNSAYEVVARGEWWRLLTAAFLHGGLMHLAMNMLGLASAGPTLERLYGRWQFAAIYLGSALAGNALSLHFAAERVVSVGASGAVFGLFAALIVGMHALGKDSPRAFGKQNLGGALFFVGYSLLQGFASARIDNAAHVGGLLAGGLLAWLLPRRLDAQAFRRKVVSRGALAGALLVTAIAFLGVRATPGVDQRQLFSSLGALQEGIQLIETAFRTAQAEEQAMKAGRISELEADERSRTVQAPLFRAAREKLQAVKLPPGNPLAAYASDALRATELMELMLGMQSVVVDGKPAPADPARFAAAEREIRNVLERMQQARKTLARPS